MGDAMKRLFVMLVALFGFVAPASAAEMHLVGDDIEVVLTDAPCGNRSILAMLQPETRSFYQAGSVTVPAFTLPLCWRVSPDGEYVWIIDENGDTPPGIPIHMFKARGGV